MFEVLLATLVLGIVGLDPYSALIVAAALAAGSTRRAISAFLAALAVTTIAVGGLLGTAVEPLIGFLGGLFDLPDAAWVAINIALSIALVAWALVRTRLHPENAEGSKPQRRGGLSAWSLTGAGVLFSASMLTDPTYYAIIALGTQIEPWGTLVLALWFLISQFPVVVLVASSFLGLHEKVTTRLQSLWARSKPHLRRIATWAMLLVAAVLMANTVHYFIREEFLIG